MTLQFERGSDQEPKGHALLYYDDASQHGRLLATYIVVLPVAVDLSRYLPPMFLSQAQMGQLDLQDISAFAFPPVPEPVEDRRGLEVLAARRDDDLVYGGALASDDAQRSMLEVNETVQAYASLYNERQRQAPIEAEQEREALGGEFNVSAIMYELMSSRERLEEMSRLLGKLQFALEGPDPRQAQETHGELEALASHFPQHYWVSSLLAAAHKTDRKSRTLTQLYLERCYRLADEEYLKAKEIEDEIARLDAEE